MHPKSRITSRSQSLSQPVALYNSSQVYAIEQAWFAQGYSSFALMQQAAWQMTQGIIQLNADNRNYQHLHAHDNIYYAKNKHLAHRASKPPRASIWVGVGNNGGDGWLIAYYLQQANANDEAIFLLEKIIEKFPNRTVLYLNLADAYYGINENEEAKVNYEKYIEFMKKSGKENKIPKRVLEYK